MICEIEELQFAFLLRLQYNETNILKIGGTMAGVQKILPALQKPSKSRRTYHDRHSFSQRKS